MKEASVDGSPDRTLSGRHRGDLVMVEDQQLILTRIGHILRDPQWVHPALLAVHHHIIAVGIYDDAHRDRFDDGVQQLGVPAALGTGSTAARCEVTVTNPLSIVVVIVVSMTVSPPCPPIREAPDIYPASRTLNRMHRKTQGSHKSSARPLETGAQ